MSYVLVNECFLMLGTWDWFPPHQKLNPAYYVQGGLVRLFQTEHNARNALNQLRQGRNGDKFRHTKVYRLLGYCFLAEPDFKPGDPLINLGQYRMENVTPTPGQTMTWEKDKPLPEGWEICGFAPSQPDPIITIIYKPIHNATLAWRKLLKARESASANSAPPE